MVKEFQWALKFDARLEEICTPEATDQLVERNRRFAADCGAILSRAGMPAHVVQCGAKACVTWALSPIRNYRDYLATDFDLAFAQWIWGVNRGVLLPPGLDEQWLLSVAHTEADLARARDVLEGFVQAMAACVAGNHDPS